MAVSLCAGRGSVQAHARGVVPPVNRERLARRADSSGNAYAVWPSRVRPDFYYATLPEDGCCCATFGVTLQSDRTEHNAFSSTATPCGK